MSPGRGPAPEPAPGTPQPPTRPPGTVQPANRAEALLASSLTHVVSQVSGTREASPHWTWAGTGPRATQGWLASRAPRDGGTGGWGVTQNGDRRWRGLRRPPCLCPLTWYSSVSNMLMLKTRPAANGRRNMKARLEPFSRSLCGTGRLRGAGALDPGHTCTRAQRVACTRVREYMHQQRSTRLHVPTGHTGAPAREQRWGLRGKGGPGHVTLAPPG